MLYLVTRSMILYLVTQSMLLYLPCFIEYVNDRFLQYIGSLLLNYAAVSVSVLIKSGIGQWYPKKREERERRGKTLSFFLFKCRFTCTCVCHMHTCTCTCANAYTVEALFLTLFLLPYLKLSLRYILGAVDEKLSKAWSASPSGSSSLTNSFGYLFSRAIGEERERRYTRRKEREGGRKEKGKVVKRMETKREEKKREKIREREKEHFHQFCYYYQNSLYVYIHITRKANFHRMTRNVKNVFVCLY